MSEDEISTKVCNLLERFRKEFIFAGCDEKEKEKCLNQYYEILKSCPIDEFFFDYLFEESYQINRYFFGFFDRTMESLNHTPESKKWLVSHCLKHIDYKWMFLTNFLFQFIRNSLTNTLKLTVDDYFGCYVNKTVPRDLLPLISYLKDFIEPIHPDMVLQLNPEIEKAKAIDEQNVRAAFMPVVSHEDSTNPRISKFGGRLPFLPNKTQHFCKKCNKMFSSIFSLYIKSLPDEIQSMFPEDSRDSVLVGYACSHCEELYEDMFAYLISKDEIDNIKYSDISETPVFNEARVITGWERKVMHLSDWSPQLKQEDPITKFFYSEIHKNYSEQYTTMKTYLGGYPIFHRGDYQPPNTQLFMEIQKCDATTADLGQLMNLNTSQVWMTTGNDFGTFTITAN